MAKEIKWTPESIETFNGIIDYLQNNWSEREIENFVEATDQIIDYITNHPKMFRQTDKKNVREALVTPHNFLIYKIYSTHIDLITFWDTRKNPRKKKK